MTTHHVFLIPGFFGFTHIGEMTYWGHVESVLREIFSEKRLDAEVYTVQSPPTASLRKRAEVLCQKLARELPEPSDQDLIHLVGHSSGGLDARLATTPTDIWDGAFDAQLKRVRHVVTVSTPHRGTPLATFFSSLLGQRLLQVLSLATIHTVRFGDIPLSALFKIAGFFAVGDDNLGLSRTILDQLFAQLLGDFTADRRAQIQAFFTQIEEEQSLLFQLTPESMDIFDAVVTPGPHVRYSAVVTRSPGPGLRSSLARGFDPYAQAMHTLYHGLHRLAGERPERTMARQAHPALVEAGVVAEDNDGIVPSVSQLFGEVLDVVKADHLDVLGHFHDEAHYPPHYDWLVTGAGFGRMDFERLWKKIAGRLLEPPVALRP